MRPNLAAALGVSLLLAPGSARAQEFRSVGSPCTPTALIDVVTHRYNISRTGANLEETCLTPDNVRSRTFGKLFTYHVQGQVYAQPLLVSKLAIGAETHNVVYLATMENWVYAYDADGGNRDKNGIPQPYWSRWLGPPMPVNRVPKDIGAALGKYNIEPFVGITSTPVIDRDSDTILLVAKIARIVSDAVDCDGQPASQQCPVTNTIFALDIRTGETRSTQDVRLPEPEKEQWNKSCGLLDKRLTSPFDAGRINMQRPALLLTKNATKKGGRIYLGFGSHQDAPCPMYHGMMIGFDYDGQTLTQFSDDRTFLVSKLGELDSEIIKNVKTLGKGGIWQAGNGPAADDGGNVYVMTGNGSYEPGAQFGSNFVKLDADLKPVDWFAPANVKDLDSDVLDIDLGSAGPLLLPGTDEIIGGGKQGKLYLLKRSSLGHEQQRRWFHDRTNPPIQYFWAGARWSPSFLYGWFPISFILPSSATGYHHIHGSPTFWGDSSTDLRHGVLYVWPERDHVKAFTYTKANPYGAFNPKPTSVGPKNGPGMPGGFLSISANGKAADSEGILWASLPLRDDAWIDVVRGALRAFRITRDGKTLDPIWTSYCADPGDRFNFGKNVPPTVANGKVYLATFSGFVSVYGLRPLDHPGEDAPPDCSTSDFAMEPSYKKTQDAARPRKR